MSDGLKSALRKALDEDDAREAEEALEGRLAKLEEGRKLTVSDFRDALSTLSDDERDEVVSLLVGEDRWKAAQASENLDETDDDEGGEPEPEPERKATTRPGRKSGQAYEYDVDDEGNVVPSDVALIYTGEDEEDEVELRVVGE